MRRWWTQQNAVVERWSLHVVLAATVNLKALGQSYKHFTSVNYDPRVVNEQFSSQVRL